LPRRAIAADTPARSPVRSASSRRRQHPGEPDQAIIIADEFQSVGPGSSLHGRGAPASVSLRSSRNRILADQVHLAPILTEITLGVSSTPVKGGGRRRAGAVSDAAAAARGSAASGRPRAAAHAARRSNLDASH